MKNDFLKLYDLTAVFSDKLPIYGGGSDPGIIAKEHYLMSRGDSCNLTQYTFGNHTGTHADMPKHFLDDGLTCETMPMGHFFGKARLLDLRPILAERKQVLVEDLKPFDIRESEIILLNLGNTPLMNNPAFTRDYVSVSLEAAAFLAERKIKTVGVDYLSIEASGSGTNPVHKTLLGKNIAILEGLVFDGFIPQGTYTLSALPLKFANGNGSPVRAVLADDFELKLVIFDMDGLILDTETISREGWCEAGRQMGFEVGDVLYRQMIGAGQKICQQRMKEYLGYTINFEKVCTIRNEHVNKYAEKHSFKIKKGLHTLLDKLDERKIKKCVATSTNYNRAKELLTSAGIFDRFDYVIGGDDIKNGKPDPEIFLKAAADGSMKPENCIVLEDSENGAEAAYRAGIRTYLVPDMFYPGIKTLARVSAVCEDLGEVAKVI